MVIAPALPWETATLTESAGGVLTLGGGELGTSGAKRRGRRRGARRARLRASEQGRQSVSISLLVGIAVILALLTVVVLRTSFLGSSVAPGPGQTDQALTDFTNRCLGVTARFEEAEIRFDDRPTMELNETSAFVVAIGQPGFSRDLPTQGNVKATCTIQARLVIAAEDASLSPADWEEQRYLPPEPVEWSWLVTPKRVAELPARIDIRPVLVTVTDDGTEESSYATKPYPFTILVTQDFWDRVEGLAKRVSALQALVIAVLGLAAAVGAKTWGPAIWRRIRRQRPTSEDSDDSGGTIGYL